MLNKMTAEICFCHPSDLSSATPALIENDFEVSQLDWIDPEGGPHVWIIARAVTELDENHFLDLVRSIVDPFGGCVIEGGFERTHGQEAGQC
jgi:hypothetical protein